MCENGTSNLISLIFNLIKILKITNVLVKLEQI